MLETRIAELTAAVLALTAQLQGQAIPHGAGAGAASGNGGVPAAPPAAPAAAPASFAAPAAAPLANGMPGGPFTPAAAAPPAAAAFTPATAGGAPFTDLAGCTKYAMDSYAMLEAKGAGRGEVVTQLIQHLCGSNSINDLPVAAYNNFYTELEKQKAL